MTPGARVAAAIECLDQIFAGEPAEKTLTRWARGSRFAGSKDRAAVRDHVFDALRRRDSCVEAGGSLSGRSVMIGLAQIFDLPIDELFSGEGHAPTKLSASELKIIDNQAASKRASVWNLQDWCIDALEKSHPNDALQIAQALQHRAPLDLRVNLRKSTLAAAITLLAKDSIDVESILASETALRVKTNPRKVKNSSAYLDGVVELQDAGSQALIQSLPLRKGMKVLDYCAGGGGKSLAISALADVDIVAYDVNSQRMKDIPERAARAGVTIDCVDRSGIADRSPFDLVLCDVPCSGSGAWRRSPDAKWRASAIDFEQLLVSQSKILRDASAFVGSKGYLCYATCSLFAQENEEQVDAFLSDIADFEFVAKNSWTPLDGSDGFFIAVLQSRR